MTTSTLTQPIELSASVRLEPILAEHQEELYHLMRRIYPAAYAHLWKDGGAQYVEQLYRTDNFYQELDLPCSLYYFVNYEGERVGILRLVQHQNVHGEYDEQSTKLQRIYLAPELQGKGIGKLLIAWCSTQFLQQEGDRIWLEVMETESKALGFYQRVGFEIVDNFEFDAEMMYPHLRGMYLMEKAYRG
ncbi:MAG: GNAT family N-acetyltransferase [Bacteroidota bacterium]